MSNHVAFTRLAAPPPVGVGHAVLLHDIVLAQHRLVLGALLPLLVRGTPGQPASPPLLCRLRAAIVEVGRESSMLARAAEVRARSLAGATVAKGGVAVDGGGGCAARPSTWNPRARTGNAPARLYQRQIVVWLTDRMCSNVPLFKNPPHFSLASAPDTSWDRPFPPTAALCLASSRQSPCARNKLAYRKHTHNYDNNVDNVFLLIEAPHSDSRWSAGVRAFFPGRRRPREHAGEVVARA